MPMTAEFLWIDGELVPASQAVAHVLSHTLHYGLGVFEGIRCYATGDGRLALFRLDDHLRRLYDSAKACLIEIPFGREELARACREVVLANGAKACYVRPLVFLGAGRLGLGVMDNPVRVAVASWPWPTYLGEEGLRNGVRALISSFTRGAVNASMAKAKIVGQYVNSILARREAQLLGCEEAILLDAEGYVAEGSGENLFAVRDGVVWTAPAGGAILPGLTRDAVLHLARDLGYPVREERFSRDFLWAADEAFFAGTAVEVTPIREVDHRKIGSSTPGPITQALQNAFFDLVRGSNEKYLGWLSRVEPSPDGPR